MQKKVQKPGDPGNLFCSHAALLLLHLFIRILRPHGDRFSFGPRGQEVLDVSFAGREPDISKRACMGR